MEKLLSDIGEFEFISRMRNVLGKAGESVVKGIGDDCAVIRYKKDKYLLFAADMIIEGVHFYKGTKPEAVGHKALAVNISDIAACGGIPRWATVSIGLPHTTPYDYAAGLYKGIKRLARLFDMNIVGGDTNASDKIIVSVSILGEVEKRYLTLRSGAKRGDAIILSGSLSGKPQDLLFTPRIKKARLVVKRLRPTSMIDISDGLLSDLNHILEQSRKGAVIYEGLIPKSPSHCSTMKILRTGEQFELIFTISPDKIRQLPKGYFHIGHITANTGKIVYEKIGGKQTIVAPKGYSHF